MNASDPAEDIERIRRTREGKSESSDESEVEIYVCPIEDCSRTVIGDRTHLMNHVRQAGDDAHDGLELNTDLEIVEQSEPEDDYHSQWGPGLREDSDEQESIYVGYEGDWGPGAPMG
jgi:hypothetical protein